MKMAVSLSTDRNFIKTLAMRFESYGPFCSCLACLQISLFHFITTWKLSEIDPVSDGQVRPIVLCNPWGSINPAVSEVFTFLSSMFPY